MLALLLFCADPAMAQETGAAPLPPPDQAPRSRLTVSPADIERWIAAIPATPEVAVAPEDEPGSMVTPPPPAPSLVAPPPPPPPSLVTPPPTPNLTAPAVKPPVDETAPPAPPTEVVAPTPPTAPDTPAPVPTSPPAETGPATTPPPPPVLTPPEEPQVATLPPDSPVTTPVPAPPVESIARPGDMRILYSAEATELPGKAKKDLDRMAAWLRANPSVRLQIVGYASESSKTGSQARRRSLFRTIAVRTYLIENGVLSTRMDVRALGDRTEEEPKDRVEIKLPPP